MELKELHQIVQDALPSEAGDASHLVIASVALASHDPTAIGPLYRFLADQKFAQNPEKMEEVASQLSDVMHKAWTLLGIPPIIVALSALSKEHGKSHPGQGDLNAKWIDPPSLKPDGPLSDRGKAMLSHIYGPDLLPKIFSTWGKFRGDFVFLEMSVIYGLYLADHSVLSEIQASCVTVACMLCTGFALPTLWHLRGLCRLLGARGDTVAHNQEVVDQVQRVVDAVRECVVYYEMEDKAKATKWPTVTDVEKELGGFGNDLLKSNT